MYSTFLRATFIALGDIGKPRLLNGHLQMRHLGRGSGERHAKLDGDWGY